MTRMQTVRAETRRSLKTLNRWNVFIREVNDDGHCGADEPEDANGDHVKQCLSDVRAVSTLFIQSLDMFREKKAHWDSSRAELESRLVETARI